MSKVLLSRPSFRPLRRVRNTFSDAFHVLQTENRSGMTRGPLAAFWLCNIGETSFLLATRIPLTVSPDVDATQQSEIVSILSAGTFFGALLSAPLADQLGRRWAMIFNTGVFTLGVILQTVAAAIPDVCRWSPF